MSRKAKLPPATLLSGVLEAAQEIFETEGCCPVHPLGQWWQESGRGEPLLRPNGVVMARASGVGCLG